MNESVRLPASVHAVSFQRSREQLNALVVAFLVAGFSKAQPGFVIATSESRHGIFNALSAGLDLAPLERDGLLMSWDADESLGRLLVGERIDERLLGQSLTPMLQEASGNGSRPIRIYGELAGLLWGRDLRSEARQLEDFTNRLAGQLPILSLCGYDANDFSGAQSGAEDVCGWHTHVCRERWDDDLISPPLEPSVLGIAQT